MNELIKKAIPVGNSAGVRVPRAWLSKEVKVILFKKSNYEILIDVLRIIKSNNIDTKNIISISLVGSYARKEETIESDIDILVITEDIDDNLKDEDYDLMLVSKELLNWKIRNDIFPILPMIKEAVPLLNGNYLKEYINSKITWKNIKWYINTTDSALKISIGLIRLAKKYEYLVGYDVAYSLILRLRTLYFILNILDDKKSSNGELKKLVEKVTGSTKAYEMYLELKSKNKGNKGLSVIEAEKLINYVERMNRELKKRLK